MSENTLKRMAATPELKVGHFLVEFATPGIGHILKAAGCEFVILDTEHSGYSFETVRNVAQYTRAADLPLVVRVPSKEYHHIARAADMGAEGIMLPMVGSAEEAQHILTCLKYPPTGGRGAVFQFAHDDYQPGMPLDKMKTANRRTALFTQIETAEGVANVDAIAAVDGVDVLWVGHFDLSNSLGIPGQFDHPDFLKATDAVVKAARKHGKAAGRLIPTVEQCVELYKSGFDFISYSGDVWAFYGAIKTAVDDIRKGCSAVSKRRATAAQKSAATAKPKPAAKPKPVAAGARSKKS
jgi:2-keto-3-deoxy-L-rhamnonate aldolase RhmA